MEICSVINVRNCTHSDDYTYVGRPSKYGNQYIIGPDGNRNEVIEKFRSWFFEPEQAELRTEAIKELRGKTLGCFCKPAPCHGDILFAYVNPVGDSC